MLTDTGKVLNGAGLENKVSLGHAQFATVWYLVDIHMQMASKHLDTWVELES